MFKILSVFVLYWTIGSVAEIGIGFFRNLYLASWEGGTKKNLNLRKLLIVSVYIKIALLMLLSLKHEMFLTFTVIIIHWEDKCMAILNFLFPYSLCKQVVSLRHMTFCNHWSK